MSTKVDLVEKTQKTAAGETEVRSLTLCVFLPGLVCRWEYESEAENLCRRPSAWVQNMCSSHTCESVCVRMCESVCSLNCGSGMLISAWSWLLGSLFVLNALPESSVIGVKCSSESYIRNLLICLIYKQFYNSFNWTKIKKIECTVKRMSRWLFWRRHDVNLIHQQQQ